jgi:uncharacterized protein
MYKILKKIVSFKKRTPFRTTPPPSPLTRSLTLAVFPRVATKLRAERDKIERDGPQVPPSPSSGRAPLSPPVSKSTHTLPHLPPSKSLTRVPSMLDLQQARPAKADLSLSWAAAIEERSRIDELPNKMPVATLDQVLTNTIEFVGQELTTKLSPDLVYHNITHTKRVVATVTRLADEHNRICLERSEPQASLSDYQIRLLQTAAWFHDAGFTNVYFGHEAESACIAGEQLKAWGYGETEIELAQEMILATKLPQNPSSFSAQILCDADIDNFGTDMFMSLGELVRQELVIYGLTEFQDKKRWFWHSFCLLSKHAFHTEAATNLFEEILPNIKKTLAAWQKEKEEATGQKTGIHRPPLGRPVAPLHLTPSSPWPMPKPLAPLASQGQENLAVNRTPRSPFVSPRLAVAPSPREAVLVVGSV